MYDDVVLGQGLRWGRCSRVPKDVEVAEILSYGEYTRQPAVHGPNCLFEHF